MARYVIALILWRTFPLLGKFLERYDEKIAVAMQRCGNHASITIVTVGNGVFFSVRAKVL
jgi:hypothetical protein